MVQSYFNLALTVTTTFTYSMYVNVIVKQILEVVSFTINLAAFCDTYWNANCKFG